MAEPVDSQSVSDTPVSGSFEPKRFFEKARAAGQKLGRDTIEKALWMFYAARSPTTPAWARTVIYGALAYFVLPVDAIPDVLPGVGFTDDISVLMAALGMVALHIDADARAKGTAKLAEWFGAAEAKPEASGAD